MAVHLRPWAAMVASSVVLLGCSQNGAPGPSVSANPSGQPSASSSALASAVPPYASGYDTAANAGIGAVEAKTGLVYTGGTCGTAQSCLGTPQVFGSPGTGGNDAASVTITAGARKCYAYVFFAGGFWHWTSPTVCPQRDGYNPVPGGEDHVVVPGTCANVRMNPGLSSTIVTCLSDGATVSIDQDFPRWVDGHIWWSINGHQGWMAHDFLISATA